MEKLVWTKEFESGVAIIDEHHHKILELLNILIKDYEIGRENTVEADKIIEKFDEYVTIHFRMEEYYAQRYDYPDFKKLKTEHELFDNIYRAFRYYYSTEVSPNKFSHKMLEYINKLLIEWFHHHLFGVDMDFARFIKSKNVELI